MYVCENDFISHIAHKSVNDCLGVLGTNIRHVCNKYNTTVCKLVRECYVPCLTVVNNVNYECEIGYNASIIRELVYEMDLQREFTLSYEEAKDIIDLLSTD